MAQRAVDPWFKVLDVLPTATLEETRSAFLIKAMENHPDRNHGTDTHERMLAVSDAWKSAQADISARVDPPDERDSTTAAARQQQPPSAERAAADQRSDAERTEAWRKAAAAERVAAERKTARSKKAEKAERRAAERRAEDETKARRKEAELRLKASAATARRKAAEEAKAKARDAKVHSSKSKAFLEAKRQKEAADRDAKQKDAAAAAEAAQLAQQESEAALIASASDDVLLKAAAKRGWLAYYAHVSLVRSLRHNSLTWPALSAERTNSLSLSLIIIEELAHAADPEVIGMAAAIVPRSAKARAIAGIRDGIIIPAASGLARVGVLDAIFRFFGVVRLFYLDLTNPPSKPRRRR